MAFKKGTTLNDPQPRPFVDCAFAGCGVEALCRVRTKTGWANLCVAHYEAHGNAEARAYAAKHDLNTVKEHIAHQKKLLATFGNPSDPRAWMKNPKSEIAKRYADEVRKRESRLDREPGQDDEELCDVREREGVEA